MRFGSLIFVIGVCVYLWAPLPYWCAGGLVVVSGLAWLLNAGSTPPPPRRIDVGTIDPRRFYKED